MGGNHRRANWEMRILGTGDLGQYRWSFVFCLIVSIAGLIHSEAKLRFEYEYDDMEGCVFFPSFLQSRALVQWDLPMYLNTRYFAGGRECGYFSFFQFFFFWRIGIRLGGIYPHAV